jgi:hypothetical protein
LPKCLTDRPNTRNNKIRPSLTEAEQNTAQFSIGEVIALHINGWNQVLLIETEGFRRRIAEPTRPKPAIISAQLAGSGTAPLAPKVTSSNPN